MKLDRNISYCNILKQFQLRSHQQLHQTIRGKMIRQKLILMTLPKRINHRPLQFELSMDPSLNHFLMPLLIYSSLFQSSKFKSTKFISIIPNATLISENLPIIYIWKLLICSSYYYRYIYFRSSHQKSLQYSGKAKQSKAKKNQKTRLETGFLIYFQNNLQKSQCKYPDERFTTFR